MSAVSVAAVGRALQAVLEDAGATLLLHDRATGETMPLPLRAAADPAALLPVFVVAGDAVREEATGKSLALRIARDPEALLGYRLDAVGNGTFSTVMLFTMEAVEQASASGRLVVNDLIGSVWQAIMDRANLGSAAPLPSPNATSASAVPGP